MNNQIFRKNIVFGSAPIGNPADITLNVFEHLMAADIILVEHFRVFAKLVANVSNLQHSIRLDLDPQATIYSYSLESKPSKAQEVNDKLIQEIKNGKKVFVISDEGASLFLEPMVMLKNSLLAHNIPYQVIPGPAAAMSIITNTEYTVRNFFFGGSLEPMDEYSKNITLSKVKSLGVPAAYMITAPAARPIVEKLQEYFDDTWKIDLSINLSMPSEKHVFGSFKDILTYIDSNSEKFMYDREEDKYAILICPDESKDQSFGNLEGH